MQGSSLCSSSRCWSDDDTDDQGGEEPSWAPRFLARGCSDGSCRVPPPARFTAVQEPKTHTRPTRLEVFSICVEGQRGRERKYPVSFLNWRTFGLAKYDKYMMLLLRANKQFLITRQVNIYGIIEKLSSQVQIPSLEFTTLYASSSIMRNNQKFSLSESQTSARDFVAKTSSHAHALSLWSPFVHEYRASPFHQFSSKTNGWVEISAVVKNLSGCARQACMYDDVVV